MSIASMIAKAGTTLTHERASQDTLDPMGGRVARWSQLAQGVACWVQPAGGRVVEAFSQRGIHVSHVVYTATDLACRENDRLTVGSTVYAVQSWQDKSAGLAKLFAAYVSETL